MTSLNRIGIILNFVAGFMLAPDLIGFQRISRAEEFLELKLPAARKRLLAFISLVFDWGLGLFGAFILALFQIILSLGFWLVRLCWLSQKHAEKQLFVQRLKASELEPIPLVSLARMTLQFGHGDLPNRVLSCFTCSGK